MATKYIKLQGSLMSKDIDMLNQGGNYSAIVRLDDESEVKKAIELSNELSNEVFSKLPNRERDQQTVSGSEVVDWFLRYGTDQNFDPTFNKYYVSAKTKKDEKGRIPFFKHNGEKGLSVLSESERLEAKKFCTKVNIIAEVSAYKARGKMMICANVKSLEFLSAPEIVVKNESDMVDDALKLAQSLDF